MQLFLERRDAMVQAAASIKEAIALYEAELPAVVVSDIGMPNEDGDCRCREQRARYWSCDLPTSIRMRAARSSRSIGLAVRVETALERLAAVVRPGKAGQSNHDRSANRGCTIEPMNIDDGKVHSVSEITANLAVRK